MLEMVVFLLAMGVASISMLVTGAMVIEGATAPFDPPIAPARIGRPPALGPPLRVWRVVVGMIVLGLGALIGVLTLLLLSALPPHAALTVLFTLVAVPIAIARSRRAQIKVHAA